MTALLAYERLRTEVLQGRARPEGLGAVVHHGLLRGLTLLLSSTPAVDIEAPPPALTPTVIRDPQFLRLLANMVLQTQAEVMHVY